MVPVNPKWRISPSRLKSLTEITYIAMTTHYWGKADRVDEAIKQMKKSGGSTTKVKVWAYPKASEPHVNDIGSIVYGRENHHVTSCEIAEEKLREFGCDDGLIEKVKHCIFAHRGSKNIVRESIEAEVLADADSMSHFDDIGGLFRAAYVTEEMSHDDARSSVKNKLMNSFAKLSADAKKVIESKFEAAMLLLD